VQVKEQRLDPFEPKIVTSCDHCDTDLYDGDEAIVSGKDTFCHEQCLAEHLIAMGRAERVEVK